MGNSRIAVDRQWREYPIGTKAHSCIGGHWTRTERGWRASSGCTFPTPGGDAVGNCIEFPENHPAPEYDGDIRDPAAGCWHITHDYSNSDPHHCRKACVPGTQYCADHQKQ
jgi:hypothetical protein